mgnify:CR=1 FL=1
MAARENKEIRKKNCVDGYMGNACVNGLLDYYHRTTRIEHAENFDMIIGVPYLEKERARGLEKVVIALDIAAICIAAVDIVLMLIGV